MPEITTQRKLGEMLRYGRWAFPGGYEVFYVTDDGEVLCYPCVKKDIEAVLDSVRNEINDGWRIVGFETTASIEENTNCVHCNYSIWKEDD
tara:strand:- start:306 stop:578 length:273 start_codon:yes stop_codon:yes gene_type:complete